MLSGQILTQFRRHILKDIDPYVCLFEACDKPNDCFKTVDDWLNHIQWQHTLIFSCQSAGHESELFNSSADLERHMELEHRDEFSELQLPFLVNKSAKPCLDTFTAFARARQSIGASEDITKVCPLCKFSAAEAGMPSKSTSSVLGDASHGDRVFKNILNHIASHMESVALLSLPAADDLGSGVSNELRWQVDDIIERDNQDLPPAIFADEPSGEMTEIEGSYGKALPINDYLMKNGWSYILESPDVRKTFYPSVEHDETLQPFIARYISERSQTPPKSYFIVPFRRDPDFVGRGGILTQIHDTCSRPAARAALVGLGGVG